jgi:hypothetical protein
MLLDHIDPPVRPGNQQLAMHELLYGKHHAIFYSQTDHSPGRVTTFRWAQVPSCRATDPEFSTALLAYSTWLNGEKRRISGIHRRDWYREGDTYKMRPSGE